MITMMIMMMMVMMITIHGKFIHVREPPASQPRTASQQAARESAPHRESAKKKTKRGDRCSRLLLRAPGGAAFRGGGLGRAAHGVRGRVQEEQEREEGEGEGGEGSHSVPRRSDV